MTKTIEFIEKEIENSKKFLDRAINYNLTICFKNETEKLQTLEQIKCELEAWEICKNKLNLKVQTEEAVTEGFCMKGYWLLVEQYPYTQTTIIEQEEYEIFKKALEVYDE